MRDLTKLLKIRKPLLIELRDLAEKREIINKRIRDINSELNSLDNVLIQEEI